MVRAEEFNFFGTGRKMITALQGRGVMLLFMMPDFEVPPYKHIPSVTKFCMKRF